MAAGGFRTFVSGEVLDEDKINDYLMQGVLVFADSSARTSAIASPVHGMVSFLKDSDTIEFYDGSQWTALSSGLANATITGTTGSPGTGTFTDANSISWNYYRWTGAGSITIGNAGYADVLVIGGGGASKYNEARLKAGGGAGALRFGQLYLPTGTHTITVGAGGSGTSTASLANAGSSSSIGSLLTCGGGSGGFCVGTSAFTISGNSNGGTNGAVLAYNSGSYSGLGGSAGPANGGLSLNYAGSSVTYGVGGSSSTPVANTGSGGDYDVNGSAGAAGVVIVKVPA